MLRYQSSEICRNLEIWQGTSVDVGSAQGSVKDSAEPGGEEDNISKSDQKKYFLWSGQKWVSPRDRDWQAEGRDLNLCARIKSENLKLRELYF